MRTKRFFVILGSMVFGVACSSGDDRATSEDELQQRTCGGVTGKTCKQGYYCQYPADTCGAGDQLGTCKKIVAETTCPEGDEVVCSCNGSTHPSACAAAAHGLSVAHAGPCEGEGKACGGIAAIACDPGMYCNIADGSCGTADELGVCETKPTACAVSDDPVCGCDAETYANSCEAAKAGASIQHYGACQGTSSERACGGLAGVPCLAHQYCDHGASCGFADEMGICQPQPDTCTGDYDPVCGCDGVTYDNACHAAGSGVSVFHDGSC
jgi:hypothetical protein